MGPLIRDSMGRTYVTHVPGIAGSGLTDRQIADVLNYVVATYSGEAPSGDARFTAAEVTRLRAQPVTDVVALRRSVVARLAKTGVKPAPYPWP